MRTFAYRGYDSAGVSRRGLIEAVDAKEAREKLATRGVLAEHVATVGGGQPAALGARPRSFDAAVRIDFYRELGVLLGSGLPLVAALEVLIESPELGVSGETLAALRDSVKEGMPLESALAAANPRVRPFERAIIEAGEKSGSLDGVLERLALFMEEQQRLREKIVSALIYPGIILCFALAVATVMLGFVIPSAVEVLRENARVELPALTRFMMTGGRWLFWSLPFILAGGVAGIAYARRRSRRDAAWGNRMDQRIFRLPVIGRGYSLVVNLRCARTLGLLLKGGVGLVEALPMAGRATGSRWVAGQLEIEADSVRHGSSLADAIRRVPVLAGSLPAWIQAGEASGALERLLDTAGNAYQHQWDRFVARTLSWLEPVLIAMIGAFVLLVVLSVLLPILSLNRLLG